MRNSIIASTALIAAASAVLLTGCPLACGGFDGGGDQAYARANGDTAIVCSNGGFTGSLGGTALEGRAYGKTIVDGATGGVAMELDTSTWNVVELDEVGLDHADVMCQDLATRAWWTNAATVPVATAIAKPAELAGACSDGKDRGAHDTCEDVILMCPDGRAMIQPAGGELSYGQHSLEAGELGIYTDAIGFAGTYRANGTMTTYGLATNTKVRWTTRAVAGLDMSCE